ncbi:imidazolonepropionase-like amidohydrolase [Kribbella sp. VKM Ac-2569]|uniref:amidohydrolase family protein n=1 Tax=Kribbella sp. VKM Ac-2569 TaxID=2512220 RepID=UPI00102B6692|nr:amidohydrolase family protein [Kribbella sp. VKM Ac-2569]RZT26792.1 imidazolonepropionase-like amidohydrolase [Kribbella sp. VKM Ac-2569]
MSGRLVLRDGSVFDVGSGVVHRADVVVEGERIVEVGIGLDGDDAIDCDGGLLVPGFIDCHTHLCIAHTRLDPFGLPRSVRPLSAVPVLRTLLSLGVTTVRDAWGADAGVRMAVEKGWIDGPQVLLSLRQVGTTGGIGDLWAPRTGSLDFFEDPSLPDPIFNGADGARAVVRRMVRAGADWIKVTVTGSLAIGKGLADLELTEDEMAALVDEAQRRGGRRVMVHAHGARAAELAARAGAGSIEHGTYLDEAAVHAMAEHGTWYVPTLSVTQSEPTATPEGAAEAHLESMRLAIAAGVRIAMGTDNPVRPHTEVLWELRHLAAAGLGDVGALRASTIDAARLLGLADDRGEIAVGKRADMVLLEGVDLDCSSLESRIQRVFHNGAEVGR